MHRRATQALSVAMVVLGLAMLVATATRGGGPLATGTVFGVLFVLGGAGRLYLAAKDPDA